MRFRSQAELFAKGKQIPPPVCEEIRLFAICSNMQWAHLPSPGGIYDQHPVLIERFMEIFRLVNEEEKRKDAERSNKNKTMGRGGRPGRRPSMGR